jgi:secreted PhoX family phosphatase
VEGKPAWGSWLLAKESSRGAGPLEDHREEGSPPPVSPVARGGATKTRANTKKERSQN